MAYVLIVALVLVMIGELADKSQLLALVLATRYRAWQVLLGIFIATFVVHFFTTLAGQALGGMIPASVLPWISGTLFVGFGIWTLRGDADPSGEAERAPTRFGPVVATAVAFFFAELGDKTQIMTLTIAADPGSALLLYLRGLGPTVAAWMDGAGLAAGAVSPAQQFWAVTLGSTIGMVIADAVAIGAGRLLGRNLPEAALRRGSGIVFILFGVATVIAPYVVR